MLVEVVVGIAASSLALLSDAGHMLTDAAAIALALFAARVAKRRAGGSWTFGFRRVEILSAQINGLTLLLLAAYVFYEGIRRLIDPPAVDGSFVLVVAVLGAFVNLGAALALSRANRGKLNIEGAFQHNLYDLYSSIATAIAAGVIIATGYYRADAIASLVIAIPMTRSGVSLLLASSRVLLEAAPVGMKPDEIGAALAAEDGVVEVHDLHVWEVTSGFPALSAHVTVKPDADCHGVRRQLAVLLKERFDIEHTTLQVDHAHRSELLTLEGS
ncbi:MAG: cation transporter [Thermoleophilaceae bacterium]|nr:cation transporter [Thermoleophilaceae bacterium]